LGVKILLLFLAGGLGTLSRYQLAGLAHRLTETGFPVGTLAVNMAGCFLFGLAWTLLEERLALGPDVRIIVLTGFLGAFTTFSTFVFETANLLRFGQWAWAAANIVGQNGVGIACLLAGIALAKLL
jgi:fluoride exporter